MSFTALISSTWWNVGRIRQCLQSYMKRAGWKQTGNRSIYSSCVMSHTTLPTAYWLCASYSLTVTDRIFFPICHTWKRLQNRQVCRFFIRYCILIKSLTLWCVMSVQVKSVGNIRFVLLNVSSFLILILQHPHVQYVTWAVAQNAKLRMLANDKHARKDGWK